ncbi:MAG TPA: SGNH/GDSL hydrolase family protein [Anaerolineales bacterium]|nr:SGNH/GDSL hydrolase family protein [Anaerolineales bacterium]
MCRKVMKGILLSLCSLAILSCSGAPKERKIEFIYMALGASDATGVGAIPLTEGYVYLINRGLQQRIPGTFLINLGVPVARIDLIKEQVRVAKQLGTKADLVTVWTGTNDLVHGDDPRKFQEDLRFLLRTVHDSVSKTIVIANIPDLTQLPRFRATPSPVVTLERIKAYNRAIESEAAAVDAALLNLFAQPVRENLVFDLDGFHPNEAGHRELARLFLDLIFPLVKAR